jgi:hypothetical protein
MSQKSTPGRARRWPGSPEQRQAGTASAPPASSSRTWARLSLHSVPPGPINGRHPRPGTGILNLGGGKSPVAGPQCWPPRFRTERTGYVPDLAVASARQVPCRTATARGYQIVFAALTAQQPWLRPNRTVSPAVYLYITALGANILNCRCGCSRLASMVVPSSAAAARGSCVRPEPEGDESPGLACQPFILSRVDGSGLGHWARFCQPLDEETRPRRFPRRYAPAAPASIAPSSPCSRSPGWSARRSSYPRGVASPR